VKLGLQLYQVDHRSYLLDFRNLNTNTDERHPSLNNPLGLNCFFCSLFNYVFVGLIGNGGDDDMENVQPNRSLSWDFSDNENAVTSSEEGVSEVMEFFEMAASLIRTLAPDSAPKPSPSIPATSS
jgi:hypothetical protein